jgi:O-Antigen ligase
VPLLSQERVIRPRAPAWPRPNPINVAAVVLAIALGAGIASPERHLVLLAFAMLVGTALVVWLPPPLFLAGAVLVLASSSAFEQNPFIVGSAKVYTLDLLLFAILVRAALPREREARELRLFTTALGVATAVLAVVMLTAGVRGFMAGNSVGATLRLETALIYFPLAFWGYSRIIRERPVSLPLILRALLVATAAVIAYAVYTRLTNHRFEAASGGAGIGAVQTTAGVIRRDYGFFSAFQVYALLALCGLAYILFSRQARLVPIVATAIGFAATLLTLVRGLVFGVAAGAIWLLALWLGSRSDVKGGSRLVVLVLLVAVAGSVFATFSPAAARGVTERALPGLLRQSENADQNTEYRVRALKAGEGVAAKNPFGVGFVSPSALDAAGFPPIYIPHSQWASLLAFTGWAGILAFVWAGIALARRSFQLPAAAPWLHPVVGALLLFVLVQGSGWDLLFSQPWALGMLALILALRFSLSPTAQHSDT